MLVGTLVVQVYIPSSTSLKDKRQVVKSVIHRVQNRFNVSVVELNNEDYGNEPPLGWPLLGIIKNTSNGNCN